MSISDKTRKILWGRSGSRCAMCRRALVVDRTQTDDDSIVADECHIVSSAPNGPRHKPGWTPDEHDTLDNLILMCRVHHKLIDDQYETYTVELLQQIKANHQKWVEERLDQSAAIERVRIRRIKENVPVCLIRITSGGDLLHIMNHAYASALDHDELQTAEEVDLVGGFLQDLRDWGELGDDLEPAARARAAFSLSNTIHELTLVGFAVFGGREVRRIEGGVGEPTPWPIAIVRVVRATNPESIAVDTAADVQEKDGDGDVSSGDVLQGDAADEARMSCR